jgi:isocitrate dehydrogenase
MQNNIIQADNKKLQVPDEVIIPFIEGDGIGRDITRQALKVIDRAIKKAYNSGKKIIWQELLAGARAFQKLGKHLPEQTIELFKKYRVGIKGPLTTPVAQGFRSLNVALRQKLDLYVCLRPVKGIKAIPAPIQQPDRVALHIFRENTEDIYAGIEYEQGTERNELFKKFILNRMNEKHVRFPDSTAFGVKPISREGTERLVRSAIEYSLQNHLPSVTLVHKGNIMKYTEGAFKKWGYQLAEKEFADQIFSRKKYHKIKSRAGKFSADEARQKARQEGKIIVKDVIADAFFQELLLRPENYSVIATMNLNGDYISDMAAAMVGGIGISPGANINYESGRAIFEATHGTAPDIAGTGKANPTSFLLSAVMMLNYLGWEKAAGILKKAIINQIRKKRVTADLYNQMNNPDKLIPTSSFMEEIINNIQQ